MRLQLIIYMLMILVIGNSATSVAAELNLFAGDAMSVYRLDSKIEPYSISLISDIGNRPRGALSLSGKRFRWNIVDYSYDMINFTPPANYKLSRGGLMNLEDWETGFSIMLGTTSYLGFFYGAQDIPFVNITATEIELNVRKVSKYSARLQLYLFSLFGMECNMFLEGTSFASYKDNTAELQSASSYGAGGVGVIRAGQRFQIQLYGRYRSENFKYTNQNTTLQSLIGGLGLQY